MTLPDLPRELLETTVESRSESYPETRDEATLVGVGNASGTAARSLKSVFGTLFPNAPDDQDREMPVAAIGAANEIGVAGSAELAQGSQPVWLTVPYGEYGHERGTQVMDREAAVAMARHFRQVWSRLARGLRGLPVYIGHPDARGRTPVEQEILAREYPDKRVYGWVLALEEGRRGMRLQVRWSRAGQELVESGEFGHFSPHWGMLPVEGRAGSYRPVELYSLGLTNQPNIPGLTLNAEPELDAANVWRPGEQALPPSAVITEAPVDALNEERRALCAAVVEVALNAGRIPVSARGQWLRNLELDFARNERLLQALPASWNTSAANPVKCLGERRERMGLHLDRPAPPAPAPSHVRRPDRVERIAREVAQRQKAAQSRAQAAGAGVIPGLGAGGSFHEIYQGVKRDHPEWFMEG